MEKKPNVGLWIENATVYELLLLQRVVQSKIDELMEKQTTLEEF